MPFCTNCGASVQGQFCTNCGTPLGQSAGASGAQPPVPPSPVSSPVPSGPEPVTKKKKTSPVVWVLVGCLGLVVIIAIALSATGLFVAHKFGNAKNPALAAVQGMVALNPEVETVSVDEDRGLITLREKKTGKEITLNFEDVKRGRISFQSSDGEKLELGGEGKLPSWLPAYPGAKNTGQFAATGKNGSGGTLNFQTGDSAQKVLSFYEEEGKKNGLAVEARPEAGPNSLKLGDGTRDAVITAVEAAGSTNVTVIFGTKDE